MRRRIKGGGETWILFFNYSQTFLINIDKTKAQLPRSSMPCRTAIMAKIPYVRKIIVDMCNVGIFNHSTDGDNQ